MTPDSSQTTSAPASVEEVLAAVKEALRTQHAAYLEALRTRGLAPLQETLEEGIDDHRKARAVLSMERTPSRRELWEAVRRYRQITMEAVWRPVRSQLETLELGGLLGNQEAALREGREALAAEVPETITRPEPEELYAPAEADGWGHRVGKALVRGGRFLRALVEEQEPAEQTIPMAELVTHHAAAVLPGEQAEALEAAEQRFVHWVARLEREASAWTHRLLELERVLDRPAFHSSLSLSAPPDEPSDDPTTGVMRPDVEAVHAEAQEQAASLYRCLRDGCALHLDDVAETFREGTETTIDRLRSAAGRAGTFAETKPSASLPHAVRTEEQRRRQRLERWPDWFDEAAQRLAFLDTLATLRDDLRDRHRSLVTDVLEAGLGPARSIERDTTEQLEALRETIDGLLEGPGAELDLVQRLDHQIEAATTLLEQRLFSPLQDYTPRRATQAVLKEHEEALASMLDAQPGGFVFHSLPEPGPDRIEPTEVHVLQWRNECREVLDELLFDGWEAALTPLLRAADAVPGRAAEVRAIVQFNLGAALQELQDLRALRRQDRGREASFVENARELALGGLDRAIRLLRTEESLDRVSQEVLRRTWTTTTETWTELHDQVRAAGQTRAYVLRLRGNLVRGTRWLAAEAGRRVRATTTQFRRTVHRMQRQARRLVRLGHAAVGTSSVDETDRRETMDALSTVDAVLADLPLVYRRLFSFRPIQDQDLLVGRDADRVTVERHAERWREGLTNALVLTGPPGSGRTSLLNVLRKAAFRSAQRHAIELTERIQSESAFANIVIRALNLSLDPEDAPSLADVAAHLKAQPVPERLRVCTIEHLEHVFRRRVGGTALGARILGFLSETDSRVLWIATTTDATWQFVEASEPAAARLLSRHALDPLDRDELEELILTRHRRSGLRLTFELPDPSAHPILARRVRAFDDEEQRQAFLQTEFFDRLHEVSGQNVMLALFYWFRSVTLDEDEATLRVRPLKPISFDVLDTLPLPHAFALKALLEHRTLTVDELAEVQGVDPATSRALLETLGNALLIAPADRVEGPGVFQFASVDRETRYRIRPLLIHPVVRCLRSRNIVH